MCDMSNCVKGEAGKSKGGTPAKDVTMHVFDGDIPVDEQMAIEAPISDDLAEFIKANSIAPERIKKIKVIVY